MERNRPESKEVLRDIKEGPGSPIDIFPPESDKEKGKVEREGEGIGTIKARTGVKITATDSSSGKVIERHDQVAIGFYTKEKKKSSKCYWIQFFWEEKITTDKSGVKNHLKGKAEGSSGEYQLTDDPANKKYKVDSNTKDGKYSGPQRTDDEGVTIYDRPEHLTGTEIKGLLTLVTRVDVITHFEDFLFCNGTVLYSFFWDVTATYETGSAGYIVKAIGGKSINKLDDKHQKALDDHAKEPKFQQK